MRLAAIDIGSNAARLLISDVVPTDDGSTQFQKINLVRVPLRLGFDVFEKQEISPEKRIMILNTLRAYRYLLDAYGVPLPIFGPPPLQPCAMRLMPTLSYTM